MTKFCKDCKHVSGISNSFCVNPKNGINLVNGEAKVRFCETARGCITTGCGVDAKWFEEKELVPKPTFLQILKLLFRP